MSSSSSLSPGVAELLVLKDQLVGAIDQLIASDLKLPSINEPNPSVAPPHPAAVMACAYAEQLQAILQGPLRSFEKSLAFHVPACLRVAVEAHVSETLREAAEQGTPALHVDEIAKSSTLDPRKLARVLRLLAAHHIFREVKPDIFTRNRCSMSLDTGKSVKVLMSTKDFFTGSDGLAAAIAHNADDAFKGAAYMAETLLDPVTSHSYSAAECGFTRALGLGSPIWDYWAKPENGHLVRRFASAMKGLKGMSGGFPWANLKDGATIVDVGSGVGSVSLPIAKAAPHVKLILQDRKEVIDEEALELWKAEAPHDLESGRVKLMQHDFFTDQPIKGADVYTMRAIIHDWADPDALTILRHLATAASSASSLVLIEQTLTYLSPPDSFPPPTAMPYTIDLQMLVNCNAMERTKEQYEALGAKAGWKLTNVWTTGPGGHDGPWRHYQFELAGQDAVSTRAA
ncbi:hypothetical protein JCM1841_001728 [Sporobolomyces salmonicolor]